MLLGETAPDINPLHPCMAVTRMRFHERHRSTGHCVCHAKQRGSMTRLSFQICLDDMCI